MLSDPAIRSRGDAPSAGYLVRRRTRWNGWHVVFLKTFVCITVLLQIIGARHSAMENLLRHNKFKEAAIISESDSPFGQNSVQIENYVKSVRENSFSVHQTAVLWTPKICPKNVVFRRRLHQFIGLAAVCAADF